MDNLGQPGLYLAIRLGVQWQVFDTLGDVGAEPKTSTQLAEASGADPRLVGMFDPLENCLKISSEDQLQMVFAIPSWKEEQLTLNSR